MTETEVKQEGVSVWRTTGNSARTGMQDGTLHSPFPGCKTLGNVIIHVVSVPYE